MNSQHRRHLPDGPLTAGQDDPRYADLVRRGKGCGRWVGNPDYVRLVASTQDVVAAVQDAVHQNKRIAVRSGGHCYEGFVDDPAVQVVIDMSLLTDVYYDPDRQAFGVEAGATLGEVYRKLYLGWGVVIPAAGEHPGIGVGGHIPGGGYGVLCRLHGLAVDHLYGVEVVVVDESGTAHTIVATREPSDPNRELWWAHTGGGGGNFGIAIRYWFRSPHAVGLDPSDLLPKAPDSMLRFSAEWQWDDINEFAFIRLVRNFGRWCERNSAPDTPFVSLFANLFLAPRTAGSISLTGHVVSPDLGTTSMVSSFLADLNEGVGTPFEWEEINISWLTFITSAKDNEDSFTPIRMKIKDAFLRQSLSDRQVATAYRYLTQTDGATAFRVMLLVLDTYGGRVNAVSSNATASAQRDSSLRAMPLVVWQDAEDDVQNLTLIREFFWDIFADSGGVPVPGEVADGSYINHPDIDLADPQWNLSGVPWHTLYYKDNYPRLQQAKAQWDPRNIFQHALSIRPPGPPDE